MGRFSVKDRNLKGPEVSCDGFRCRRDRPKRGVSSECLYSGTGPFAQWALNPNKYGRQNVSA